MPQKYHIDDYYMMEVDLYDGTKGGWKIVDFTKRKWLIFNETHGVQYIRKRDEDRKWFFHGEEAKNHSEGGSPMVSDDETMQDQTGKTEVVLTNRSPTKQGLAVPAPEHPHDSEIIVHEDINDKAISPHAEFLAKNWDELHDFTPEKPIALQVKPGLNGDSLNIIEEFRLGQRCNFRSILYRLCFCPSMVLWIEYIQLVLPGYLRIFDQVTDFIVFLRLRESDVAPATILFVLAIMSLVIRWFVSLRRLQNWLDFRSLEKSYWKSFCLVFYLLPIFGAPIYFVYDFIDTIQTKQLINSPWPEYLRNKSEFETFVELFAESLPASVVGIYLFLTQKPIAKGEPGYDDYIIDMILVVVSTCLSIYNVLKTTRVVLKKSRYHKTTNDS